MTAPTRQAEPTTPFPGNTYLQMQGDVLRSVGFTTTSAPSALLSQVQRLLQVAASQMVADFPNDYWVEKYTTITTAASQKTYNLPFGLRKIVSAILDSVYIGEMNQDDKNRRYNVLNQDPYDAGAATQVYLIWGVDNAAMTAEPHPILELWPPPTAAGTLELYYRGQDNALSASGDILRSPPGFTNMPVYYATGAVMLTIGETDRAGMFMGLYDKETMKLKELNFRTRSEGDSGILPSYAKTKQPLLTTRGQYP